MDTAGGCFHQGPAHDEAEKPQKHRAAVYRFNHFHPGSSHIRAYNRGVAVEAHHCKIGKEPGNYHQKPGDNSGNQRFLPFCLSGQGKHAHGDCIYIISHIEDACPDAQRESNASADCTGIHGCKYLGDVAAFFDQYNDGKEDIAAV